MLRVTGTLCLTMDNIKKTVQVLEHAVKKYEWFLMIAMRKINN